MHAAFREEAVCEARALLRGSKDRPPAGAKAPAAAAIRRPPTAFLHLLFACDISFKIFLRKKREQINWGLGFRV